MKTFKQFLEESRALEQVHYNPSINQIKGLLNQSKHGRLRFVLHKDDTLHVGDAEKYTHSDLSRAHGEWKHWGNFWKTKNGYSYNVDNVRQRNHKNEKLFQNLENREFKDNSY